MGINCKDCNVEIHPLANHTGHEKWCEDCFDKGLNKDMNKHWDSFWKKELECIACTYSGSDEAMYVYNGCPKCTCKGKQ